jgi:leucyl/phenylalanyl-tRNA--protein transferase
LANSPTPNPKPGSDPATNTDTIPADLLLTAYAQGLFPMAEARDDGDFFWCRPDMRGILPIHDFHLPQRLIDQIKATDWTVTVNQDFRAIVKGCANRDETWISHRIEDSFVHLHDIGHAHCLGVYDTENQLIGGIYGLSMGSAFFGESMFHRKTNASKIALANLVARLAHCGYQLLDTQFGTPHLEQFGGHEIPDDTYQARLKRAIHHIPAHRLADPRLDQDQIMAEFLKSMQ